MLEKILLANSFLDTFERIFFVGEMGNLALASLGLTPGKVERTANSAEEYAKLKEFMLRLFEKSIEKECQIILPADFVCAEKLPLEELANKAASTRQLEKEAAEGKEGEKIDQTVSKKSLEGGKLELSEV